MFTSSGVLRYSIEPKVGHKLVANVDKELARYYRSLIPAYCRPAPQMFSAHISVVRKITPINLEKWGLYEDRTITFSYSHEVENDNRYWWLNCYSKELEEIRLELGLALYKPARDVDFRQTFHITIGNTK